jgi:archaellum component FlaC
MYPDSFRPKTAEAQPESGFIAGVKSGIAGLKGDVAALAGRTGLMDEAAAEKYIKEQEAYRRSTYKEPETWSEAPVTKALGLLGQSVPYMAAPVVAGFAPGVAGLGLAGLTSAAQFTGSNLSRQMGEGKKLGETELGSAAAASVPQAALDILSLKMLPGIRGIFSTVGKEVPEKVLLEATKQSTAKIAQDYALATGKAMGVEGLTEAGQQVFERLQAGLNISDVKARDEYFDSFIGGAVLGGAIAPVGRYVERGREQAQQQQARVGEIQKLRVQEEQQLEADRAFRESPEGMAQTVEQYDALAQQRLALQSQLVKPKKDSPTYEADKAQNREINAQINELSKQISPLATDYYKAKKVMAAAEKQAALEAMPVEDFMLQELGMEVKPVAQKQVAAPVIRRGKGQLFGVEETPPAKDTSLQDYAAGQFDAARVATLSQTGVFELGDAADYMMQDPTKAAQLVQTRTQVPGLNAKDNSTLLSGIKLRLDDLEKSKLAASKEELEQRATTLEEQETTTPKDPLALYKAALGQIDELRATGESNFDFLDPVFEKAVEGKTPAVKVNENLQPLRDAKVAQKVRSTVEGLMTQIREADRDYANAKRGGDMDVADKAYQRGNRLLEQLKTMSEEIPAGELTKGLKTGPAKPDTRATYAKELFTTRNAQEEALGTAEDAIQRLRQGETLGKETQLVKDPETGEMRREAVPYGKGVSASTSQSLIKKAEDARAAYITAVLQEAAIHRRAAGKKALNVDEAVKAASELYDTFNEWIARVQKAPRRDTYESVMVEPAQMRANKLVRQARYEQRKVADERPVGEYPLGAYDQAVEVFKEQLDAVRNKLSELPSEALRETSLIKTQFAGEEAKKVAEAKGETTKTLSGELRRMSEYVSNKLDKALERDISTPGLREMLEEAQDIIASGKVSRAFLDTVNNQAERVVSGRLSGTKTVYRQDPKQRGRSVAVTGATETDQNMRELKDALSLAKQTAGEGEVSGQGAAGQQQLFPETKDDLGYIRATPANFAKSPRMKPVWDALEKARTLANKKTAKEQADMGRLNRAVATLDRIKNGIDSIQKSTQFFWTDTSKWSEATLAKVFVKAPEVAGTPAEQEIINRVNAFTSEDKKLLGLYRSTPNSVPEEKRAEAQALYNLSVQSSEIYTKYRLEKEPAYKAKLAEALRMLSQQQRLYDADNQLLQFMQDTNEKVRTQAKELSDRLAPMKRAIKDIQSTLRKSSVLTEAQKQSMNAEAAMREQRDAYTKAVEQAMVKAQEEMQATLAELLDPDIATVEADIQKAKQTLATETAELDRINAKYKNLETVLTDRARKFLIAEGEKQSKILDDLKDKIKAMETDLQDQYETRYDELDGAQVVARAMLDRNVKDERNYLEMLEGQLALMRGETITPKSKAYPFTAQKLENQIKAQKETVRTTERRQEAFVEQEKSDQQKLESFWKDKFNGEGVRVVRRDPHKSQEKALAKIDKQIAEQEAKNNELREKLIGARLDKSSTALTKTLYGPKQNKALADGQRRVEELTEQRRGVLAKVTPLITTEQKEADKNRSIAMQALDKQVDADARLSAKERLIEELDSDIFEQRSQAEFLLGPNDKEQLADIAADPKTSKIARAEAILKIDVLNQIDVLEAQKAAYLAPKEFKAPKPATVPSTAALAAAKALRIGNTSVEALDQEELRAANEQAKNIRGTKAPKLPEPSTRRQGRTPDQDLGLFDDYEFSRGRPAQGLTKEKLEAELEKGFGEKGLFAYTRTDQYGNKKPKVVTLYNSVADFVAEYPEAEGRIPSDAKGLVKGGRAVLFANNIAKGEGLGVLLHEVGVHLGFRNFFNEGQYNALVKTVKSWAARKDDSMEARIGKAAMARVVAAETPKQQINDELLAYAVEEAMQMGINPAGVKGGVAIKNWLKMVVDAFKKALEKFGLSTKNLTAGDLVNFAYGAANLELRGTWHGSDATFAAFDTQYAGAGEGSFDRRFDGDNSLGAGPYVTPDKEYGEYYQHAVPFGKAANETGYGRYTYQDYAEAVAAASTQRLEGKSTAELQRLFESNLLHRYLNSMSGTGELDPLKNTAASSYVQSLKDRADSAVKEATANLASREKRKVSSDRIDEAKEALAYALRFQKAAGTLDVSKIKGLTKRPDMGNLYRTLDSIPRENVYSVNSTFTVGERPKLDAFLYTYGDEYALREAKNKGEYPANGLFYDMRRKLGIEKTKELLKSAGIKALEQTNDRRYIERAYIDDAPEILGLNLKPIGQLDTSEILFSRNPSYTNPGIAKESEFASRIVSNNRSWWDKIKANASGLAFETQLVDRFAGFERLAKYMDPLKGSQMLFYLRMYDQRMNFVSQAVANGSPQIVEKTRADGRKEYLLETKESANIRNVVEILKEANPLVGNGEAVNMQFTLYMAAIRAQNKGLASLNFGKDVTQAKLDAAMAAIKATPGLEAIFKRAKTEYNTYNRNLLNFVASTGALSKNLVDRLVKEDDYIPFYRVRNGVAELLIGKEPPIRIGSVAEQPHLENLVGGDEAILDFMTSSVQNTNMLVDMGMRNLATKNAVHELVNLKAATFVRKAAGANVVQFKVDGEDRYAIINSEKVTIGGQTFDTGVPGDILVKGMEGIPTQMPFLFRALAMPSQLLRKAVVLSPLYMGRQLFRDSVAAPILAGADFVPVFGALRQIGSPTKGVLEKRGITGGQQFTGTTEDISQILRNISGGKPGWMQALGKFEAMGMEADALTRRAQYNSYIEQGLSEMEATLMALESMNFNKRGASPSIHVANALIPFFNAQIQGLNVMYKAMRGQLPFSDKLKIQEKMLMRGGMMAGVTLLYAAMMEDDEAYKNATPDQKYANWFVRVPGLDEPVRVPIPFEIGYIFKALPEALYNSMRSKQGQEDAVDAFATILRQTIPGGSSYGIPQGMKVAIEAGLGKSFYTGRDILSAREKDLLPEEQFRANTSEIAKTIGRAMGVSPVKLEFVVSGYTGTLGLAFLHAVSVGIPKGTSPEQATKELSAYPIIGGAFQPNDAGGIINSVYERMNEDIKVQRTYEKLVEEGRMSDAQALVQRRGNELLEAELAHSFKSDMNLLTQAERAINASDMTGDEKNAQLKEIRKLKTGLAVATREISDKTIRLTDFP